MDPFAFLESSPSHKDGEDEILDLPDTSILFRRYLDCGKMINVWDWFESFALVCERQRERERESRSPGKGRGKKGSRSPTKGKGKQKEVNPDKETDEETWKIQVQARFMRALHELDYIGLIKHTGRKADHVMRTIWEGEG
jgi:origin recognition complex subunit 3